MPLVGDILLAAVLLTVMIMAVRAGYSRELAYDAIQSSHLASAQRAMALTPSDPEANLAQAIVLLNSGAVEQSYNAYERAAALRPRDYYLWFRLGYAHYFANDPQGAIKPFRESVRRAPYYAEPRWMLGKTLLATGQRDEAFSELRRAASSNPVYMADVIGLAWDAYDAGTIEQVIKPQTPSEFFKLALSFASNGQKAEAMRLFRQAGNLPEDDVRELVSALLGAKQFAQAYEVWSNGKQAPSVANLVNNGSFENGISREEQEFGWQFSRAVGDETRFSRDTNGPRNGQYSLRLDFGGEVDPSINLISTLVVVQPNSRYRLTWAARTRDLATGGLPIIGINDASNSDQTLVESNPMPQGTSDWQDYLLEFSTSSTTNAIYLNVRRKLCSAGCPITGHLWLDNFSLQKL